MPGPSLGYMLGFALPSSAADGDRGANGATVNAIAPVLGVAGLALLVGVRRRAGLFLGVTCVVAGWLLLLLRGDTL